MATSLDFTQQQKVLLVDDNPEMRVVMMHILRERYKVLIACDGEQALQAAKQQPDLILLDVIMPGIDGFETCQRLKADPLTHDIPVIFLTAQSEVASEQHGFDVGGVDFIAKPANPPILLSRVTAHLAVHAAQNFLKKQNEILEEKVKERTRELALTQEAIVIAMAALAETRDKETGNHIKRTCHYVRILATAIYDHPHYRGQIASKMDIDLLALTAALHDIGKVGIPDAILHKPGKLTAEEFAEMKKHTDLGRDTILVAEAHLGGSNNFLRFAREIAYCHQEKWDGSGYPQQLKGEEIPLSARMMAVADVYDALRCRRCYKDPMTADNTIEEMVKGAGTHFDPVMIEIFQAMHPQFAEIADRYKDETQ